MVEERNITVTGEAEIKVVPDEAQITLGVETRALELAKSKHENDVRMKAILGAARAQGVAEKHLATDYINIDPDYEHENGRKVLRGYIVRRSVVVTVNDLGRFDAILSSCLDAGANFVHDVQFTTTELRKHRDAARSLAMRAARDKATALARELDQSVGRPITIHERGGGWWAGYGRGWGRRDGYSGMTQNTMQYAGGGDAGDDATAPGTIGIKAHVDIVFELV
jgi:uncharacterized protein